MKYLIQPLALTFIFFSCRKEEPEDTSYCTSCHNGTSRSIKIEGKVRHMVTGQPVSGIQVGHSSVQGAGFQDVTDSLGNFKLSVGWIVGGKWPMPKPSSVYISTSPFNDTLYGETVSIDLSDIPDGTLIENFNLFVDRK